MDHLYKIAPFATGLPPQKAIARTALLGADHKHRGRARRSPRSLVVFLVRAKNASLAHFNLEVHDANGG